MQTGILIVPTDGKNDIVKKSNDLIEARYKLSLGEQRLVLLLAGQIHTDDKDFEDYEIRVSDFARLFGLKTDKSLYETVEQAADSLVGQRITLQDGKIKEVTTWLSYAKYEKGAGIVNLRFDKSLKPFLLQLKGRFTQYNLRYVMNFKSAYTIRLYELLKMKEYKAENGQFEKTLDLQEYRLQLGIDKKAYPIFADFRRWTIEPPVREISDQTDLHILETQYIKTGRKITGVRFVVAIRGETETKARQENLRIEDIKQEEDEKDHPILQAMMNYGFTLENAKSFKTKYGIKQIERNIAYVKSAIQNGVKIKTTKTAYLVSAITDDWGKEGETEKTTREELAKKKLQEQREKEAREEKKLQEDRKKHSKALQDFYNLPKEERDIVNKDFLLSQKNDILYFTMFMDSIGSGKEITDTILKSKLSVFLVKRQEANRT